MPIGVNLWDDYTEDEETYMYIEMSEEPPHEVRKLFLETILPHIDEKYKPECFSTGR